MSSHFIAQMTSLWDLVSKGSECTRLRKPSNKMSLRTVSPSTAPPHTAVWPRSSREHLMSTTPFVGLGFISGCCSFKFSCKILILLQIRVINHTMLSWLNHFFKIHFILDGHLWCFSVFRTTKSLQTPLFTCLVIFFFQVYSQFKFLRLELLITL